MNNFIITGHARSGTLFLARNMNRSKKWTVLHEAGGIADEKDSPIQHIQQRFDRDYYGESNYHLRHHIFSLNVSKKGIILRDPCEIFLSIANKKDRDLDSWIFQLRRMWRTYKRFRENTSIKMFLFDRMVSDLSYLKMMFEFFGIDDVEVTKEMQVKKINETGTMKYHSISEFNHRIQDRIMNIRDIYWEIK